MGPNLRSIVSALQGVLSPSINMALQRSPASGEGRKAYELGCQTTFARAQSRSNLNGSHEPYYLQSFIDTSPHLSMAHKGLLREGPYIHKKESVFTPEQVSQWLGCLHWPQSFTLDELGEGKFPTSLENLAALVRCHAVTFIYENTEMHYSEDHAMDVRPQSLFHRLVVDRRGSYCFGLNILFLWMLRGLGYRVYASLGRVNEVGNPAQPPEYTGLTHMVIFVQPGESNITYLVDVGCGGSGPTLPILLSDAENNIIMGTTPTEKHRLKRGRHPESSVDSNEWILEVLHQKPDREDLWRVVYIFSEREAFQNDFEIANRGSYAAPTGFFADQVMCSIHHWMEEDVEQGISLGERRLIRVGLMGRLLKRFIGSEVEFIKVVYTEEERTGVFSEFFGIELSKEEVGHIEGRRAAI